MKDRNYRGDGSYSDALYLATLAGVPVVGYGNRKEIEATK